MRRPLVIWVVLVALLLLAIASISSLERFTEWDEAVFFSQSGGYQGTTPPPLPLGPSREGGTGFLTAMIRAMGVGLFGVRVGFVLVAVGLALFVFHRLGRLFQSPVGEVAFVVYGFSWLSLAYMGSIYGSLLAGLCLTLAAVLLLELLSAAPASRSATWLGAWIGAAVAGSFWMRQIESLLGLLIMVAFSMFSGRSVIWRQHRRPILVGFGTFSALFVVPWVLWSVVQFGSLGGRLASLRTLAANNADVGVANGLSAYFEAATGTYRHYDGFANVPDWPKFVMVSFGVFVLVLLLGVLRRKGDSPLAARATTLLASMTIGLFSFFALVYSSVEVRERYLTTIVPFSAGLVGIALTEFASASRTRRRHKLKAWGVAMFGAILLAAQVAIAAPFQSARALEARNTLLTAETVRVLSENQTCEGVSRWGRAQLQLGSGCLVRGVYSPEAAVAEAARLQTRNGPGFILWPGRLELGTAWRVVDRSTGNQTLFLYFLPAR